MMFMKTTLTSLMLLLILSLSAQQVNKRINDTKSGEEILFGYCNKLGLKQAPFINWFEAEYQTYEPKMEVLSDAKQYINEELKIVVIFGTWCSDSREQLPRFLKVMDYVGYTPSMLEMIAVDRTKKAGEIDLSSYSIEKVPTFIFLKNGKEIGRIVETPKTNFEKDIISILKKY